MLAKLNAGSSPAKDDLVSKLRPEVEKPGDAAKGKKRPADGAAGTGGAGGAEVAMVCSVIRSPAGGGSRESRKARSAVGAGQPGLALVVAAFCEDRVLAPA